MSIKSLEDAEEWFLNNSSGNCMCFYTTGSTTIGRRCNSYLEAESFYNSLYNQYVLGQ